MRRSKKKSSNSQDKFEGPGVDFKSKLIGVADVTGPRGDEICSDALSVLKASALRNNKEKKEHKQRITVNITLKGIRLIDEASERIDHAHPISRISFISLDKSDKRTFGYIVGTKDGYKFFAIKTAKEAEIITATLKELFQEVYKRHQEKKAAEEGEAAEEEINETTPSEAEVNGKIEEAEEAVESTEGATDSQMIWELNDQIEEMQTVGIMTHSTSFDMMDDPFYVEGRETIATESKGDPFDDNFSPTSDQKNELGNGSLGNEKVEIAPLPSPNKIKKQNTSNTDLLSDEAPAITIKPSSSYHDDLQLMVDTTIQNGVPEIQESLMATGDPFADLKKSINQLHQQNMINQQQQQMSFLPTFPSQMNQQVPMNQPNQYSQNISNPFANNGYVENPYPPAIPARPTPPVIPARPGVNPFLPQQPPNQKLAEPSMGWTVLKTSPLPRKKEIDMSIPDPFSFLNDQPNLMTKTQPTPVTINNQSAGNNELLDLLG